MMSVQLTCPLLAPVLVFALLFTSCEDSVSQEIPLDSVMVINNRSAIQFDSVVLGFRNLGQIGPMESLVVDFNPSDTTENAPVFQFFGAETQHVQYVEWGQLLHSRELFVNGCDDAGCTVTY